MGCFVVVVFLIICMGLNITVRVTLVYCHAAIILRETKGTGLVRHLSSNTNSTFYPCTVFRQSLPLPEDALNCRWLATDCIILYRMEGLTGDNLHCLQFVLAARWTVHAKIDRCVVLPSLYDL